MYMYIFKKFVLKNATYLKKYYCLVYETLDHYSVCLNQLKLLLGLFIFEAYMC